MTALIYLAVRVALWVNERARRPDPAAHVHLVDTAEPWVVGSDGAFIEDLYFELALD